MNGREKIAFYLNIYIYLKLRRYGLYDAHIKEIVCEESGKAKGGLHSKGNTKNISIPHHSRRLADFIGILLGDGNVQRNISGSKIRTYMIRIGCDAIKDKSYLEYYVAPLCKELFDVDVAFYKHKVKNELFVILHSKLIVNYLTEMGIGPGNKIVNRVSAPDWILKNPEYVKAFLRGLIDTDGCVSRISHNSEIRVIYKCYGSKLLNDAREAFLVLGFKPSKITGGNAFYLSSRKDVEKYIKEIGFSNPEHLKRLESFLAL